MLNPNEFDFQERLLSGAAFAEMNSKSFKSLPTIWELGSCDGILSSKIPENIIKNKKHADEDCGTREGWDGIKKRGKEGNQLPWEPGFNFIAV